MKQEATNDQYLDPLRRLPNRAWRRCLVVNIPGRQSANDGAIQANRAGRDNRGLRTHPDPPSA